jgi:uncharacterized protein YciI
VRHFVVEIIYTRPFDEVAAVIDEHRAYLQTGYQRGLLLISGPQEPRVGGILVMRADLLATVQSFCDGDPYALKGVAKHRIIEFLPKSHIPELDTWVDPK